VKFYGIVAARISTLDGPHACTIVLQQKSRAHTVRGQIAMSHNIKPGPKPKKDDGTDDRRRHVDPPNKPKHPTLPIHNPKK
jgi:hypothetical protein